MTQLVVSASQWNRVARLLDRKTEIEVEIDVEAAFHEDDTSGYNVVADLPGTDKKGEIVMVGAHLDSWHPGTGATDDGAGSAVMMEVVRILKAIDARPKRTIRIGLWGGEEQGLLGSRAYVSEHFASRPSPGEAGPDEMPSFMRNDPPAPMTLKPDHAKLSAYFNFDNGTGKIRGIYLQENAALKPVFEAWLEAVKDLGATRVTMRKTGGTDHQSFDGVGLPGFQFIQDPIEYMDGVLLRYPPHRHGRLRPAAAGRPDAGRGRDRDVRVQRGDPRRSPAAQAAAASRPRRPGARGRAKGALKRRAAGRRPGLVSREAEA